MIDLPHEVIQELENGVIVATAMTMIMKKSGQPYPAHLQSVNNQHTKQIKSANWNFIW